MYYRNSENWLDRWEKLTGNKPDKSLHNPLKIGRRNQEGSLETVHDSAITRQSQKFRNRKPR